jgi:hypothetical protein
MNFRQDKRAWIVENVGFSGGAWRELKSDSGRWAAQSESSPDPAGVRHGA